jgi:hypothetical protein
MVNTPFEISYYNGSWINISPYVKQFTVEDSGIQKVPTATVMLRSAYSNLTALLTSHHYPLRVLIAPDLVNYYRIFYGDIWHPQDADLTTGSTDRMSLTLDARGITQRLADDEISWDYWADQAAAYPTTLWTYLSMLTDMLLQPDSGYDTGIAVDYAAGAITSAVDRAATFKGQTILDALRAVCDKIGYDGWTELNVNTPTIYLRPFGGTSSIATLTQPFLKCRWNAGSLDDIVNYVTVKGGTDAGMPITDRFTEQAVSKYMPPIWSIGVTDVNGNPVAGNTTLTDADNATFLTSKLGAGTKCIRGTVQSVNGFIIYLELYPNNNGGSGIGYFDCKNRLQTLAFDIMHIGINPSSVACKKLDILLTDAAGHQIRYWWMCERSVMMQNGTCYHVEIPVGDATSTMRLYGAEDRGFKWGFTYNGTDFDWSTVAKIRLESTINSADNLITKEWGLSIDNMQFIGGYEIDPFAEYAEQLSPLQAALLYYAQTATWVPELIDINDPDTNDVTLPPCQTSVLGDAFYFGMAKAFTKILLTVSQAGIYSGITLQWQYWNGKAWTALTAIQDGTNGFKTAGTNWIAFDQPANWQRYLLGGMNYYWIRAVVTAFIPPASISQLPLGQQGWIETGLHPPIFDPASIAAYGVHYQNLNDTSITSFEVAQREGWRVLNNLKTPIPTLEITVPALYSVVRPSNIVTVFVTQLGIIGQEWRTIKTRYDWNAQNKRVFQTLTLTGKTSPLPPIWAQQPELRVITK